MDGVFWLTSNDLVDCTRDFDIMNIDEERGKDRQFSIFESHVLILLSR